MAADAYDRLQAAIQDWIREDNDDQALVLVDWSLTASGVDMRVAEDQVEYFVGGSGAPHSVLGLAKLGVIEAKKHFSDGDDE